MVNLTIPLYHVLTLGLCVLIFVCSEIMATWKPEAMEFFEGDLNYSYTPIPYSSVTLFILSYPLPFFLLLFLVSRRIVRKRVHVFARYLFVSSLLVYTISFLLSVAIGNFVGKLKPTFFHDCQYDFSSLNNEVTYGTFGTPGSILKCSAPLRAIYDAMRSFPCLPATVYSAGLFLYSFVYFKYLYDERTTKKHNFLLQLVPLLFMSWFLYTNSVLLKSRQADGSDILFGCLLALLVSYTVFIILFRAVQYTNYPLLSNTNTLNNNPIFLESFLTSI